MARGCGCAGSTCGCKITDSESTSITGTGTQQNPFQVHLKAINIGANLQIADTDTLDLTLLGSGSTTDPYILSGVAKEAETEDDFTPTLTGFTLGAGGTAIGSWKRVGRRIRVDVDITFGTSPAITTTATVGLPTAMLDTPAANRLIGWGDFFDASASAYFAIPLLGTGLNTTVKFATMGTSGGYGSTTAFPAAVASGDKFRLTFEYLTAA